MGGGSYPFPFLCCLISIYFSVFAQPHTKTYLFVTYQRLLGDGFKNIFQNPLCVSLCLNPRIMMSIFCELIPQDIRDKSYLF